MRLQNDNGHVNKTGSEELVPDKNLQAKLVRWSYYLTVLVIIIAVVVLTGWQFDIELLKHPAHHFAAMNPLTAMCFILLAVSFLFLTAPKITPGKKNTAIAFAGIVTFISIIKLASLTPWLEWRPDLLIYSDSIRREMANNVPVGMAPNTMACFLFVVIALYFFYKRGRILMIQSFAFLVALLAWLSVLGYAYRSASFYNAISYVQMSFQSAFSFLCLALAILFAQPGQGIMKQLTGTFSGSITARLLIPAAILIPSILGLVRLKGHWVGIYDFETGVALFTLVIIILFLVLAWNITLILNKRDLFEKQKEDARRSHEQEIATIFQAAPDAIIVMDEQGRITEWNAASTELFGWTKDEVSGRLFTGIISPAGEREMHDKWIKHILDTKQSPVIGQTIELKAITKTNIELDIALRVAEVSIKDTRFFAGFARDITEDKKTAVKLKNFNDELSRRVVEKTKEIAEVLERLNDGFIALDRNFCYTYMNRKAAEMTHKDAVTVIGKNIWDEFPEAIGSPTYLAICQAMAEQKYISNTDYFEPLDLWQENFIYPSPSGVSVFIRDITQKKRAELEIEEARKLADKLIDSLPGVFYFFDENGRFIRWNKQFETVTGFSGNEIAAMNPTDFFEDEKKGYITERIKGVFEKGSNDAEANFVTKSGNRIPFYFKAVLITYEGNPCLLGFGMDITERKKAEEQLINSEQKYKLLFESNPLPMWMLSLPEYSVIDVNTAALGQYGYNREEFLQMNITDLRPEEERDRFRKQTNKNFRGIHHAGVWRHKRKDDSVLYVDIVTYDLYYQEKPARFVLANNVTEKYIAEEKLKESYESIRNLTEHLQRIREEERTHIAREIHDELGQQLTVLKMDIAWLNKKVGSAEEGVKEKLSDLLSMIDATVKTVRRIASELRPSLLDDLGLVPAMEWHLHEFEKRSGIATSFSGPETDSPLPDDIKIGLFRILQESLTNVARHARAKEVKVMFEQNEKEVILTITDDGIGFGKESTTKKTLGILGMKERSKMLGGEYKMTGDAGKGTTISVVIPFKKNDP